MNTSSQVELKKEGIQQFIDKVILDSDLNTSSLYSFNEILPAIEPFISAQRPKNIVEIGLDIEAGSNQVSLLCQRLNCNYILFDPKDISTSSINLDPTEVSNSLLKADVYIVRQNLNHHFLADVLQTILSAAGRDQNAPIIAILNTDGFSLSPAQQHCDSVTEVTSKIEDIILKFSGWESSEIPAFFGLYLIAKPELLSTQAQAEWNNLKKGLQIFGPILKRMENDRKSIMSQCIKERNFGTTIINSHQKLYHSKSTQLHWTTIHKRKLQIIRMTAKSIAAMRPAARPGRLRFNTLLQAYINSAKMLPTSPGNTDILCFDMFDTLVRRSVDPPERVIDEAMDFAWLLLARNQLLFTREQVRSAREDASFLIRSEMEQSGIDPECNLREILERTWDLLECSNLAPWLTDAVEEFEIECELRHLSVMPGALDYLRACKAKGKTTAIASDTYLSKAGLLRIIESVGLSRYVDHVFSSADHRTGKYSTGLFKTIADTLGVDYSNICHIGDNIVSDYLVPKSLGIRVQWYLNPSEHRRRERVRNSLLKMESGTSIGDLASSKMQLTDTPDSNNDPKDALFDLGYSIFGPLFYSFIVQVAERAIRLGIKDLYFLARDGYGFVKVFEKVWKSVPTLNKFPIPNIHYLYISRSSSLVILAEDVGTRGVELALKKDPNILIKDFLHFCGLDIPNAPAHASYGLKESDKLSVVRSTSSFKTWIQAIKDNTELKHFANEERQKLFDYLGQNNFFSPGAKALVDVGWNGTIPQFLNSQFGQSPNFPQVHVFLLGRCSSFFSIKRTAKININSGFLMDDMGYPFERKIPVDVPPLIELAASAPHGTTVGYVRTEPNGIVSPVLKEVSNREVSASASITNGWVEFIRGMAEQNKDGIAIDIDSFSKGAVANFVRFYHRPPSRFVKAIAGCMFSMDWKSNAKVNLVGAGLGWRFYYRFIVGNISQVMWFHGAARRFRIPHLFVRMMTFVHRGL